MRIIWAALLVLVIIGSIMPGANPPGSEMGADLVVHFLCYALLACLPLFIISQRKTALLVALSMAPMGYFLEILQKHVDGRTFSPEDMIANNLGVFAGIIIGAIIRMRNHYTRGEKS